MEKLYLRLSECELILLKDYTWKADTKTYKKTIEKLIEEDAVSVLCIISSIEKHLRKTAVNFRQMESFMQKKDTILTEEITNIIATAIQSISRFTSSILSNIQRGSGDRFEVQIRLEDETKETLKQMKKSGWFRTYDALLRYMLYTHFEYMDMNKLELCFSIIKETGFIFNHEAHSYHITHFVDVTKLRQIMPEYQRALDEVIEIIGG